MSFTTTRTNRTREQHLTRAGALAAAAFLIAVPGLFFVRDAVLALSIIRTDAAANVLWTLWSLPILTLGIASALAFVGAARSAPASRRTPAPPAAAARRRIVPPPRTAAFT